jgi:hypothetical protein
MHNTIFISLALLSPAQAAHEPVQAWNEAALQAIRAEKTPPPIAARQLAVLHIAMFDAANSVRQKYAPFEVDIQAPDASEIAAASAAAQRVLSEFYPKRASQFERQLQQSADTSDLGIAKGRYVAKEVLAWRSSDGSDQEVKLVISRDPGQWRPTPPSFAKPLVPQWPKVTCFALRRGFQFRSDGPPKLTSKEYTDSFNEVKRLGGKTGSERNRDQTEIAHFWADGEGTVTPPGHWNRIAQEVARKQKLSVVETARMFAFLNVAMADVSIACWDCKYHFNFWRPIHGIREADRDGNADTTSDRDWEPLLITPPFPSYTSGHSSFSGAAATVLAAIAGTDDFAFETSSDGLHDVKRRFKGFWSAAEEAGMSRIYGGIHWQFDNTDGLAGGKLVAEHVLKNCMKPASR